MKPPATIVVGEVVRLREKLNWFERLPLFGRRIVITRARGQAGETAARLRALGAEAIEFPTIEIRPAADYSALDRAIARLECYDWLIFTSANGVRFFLDRLDASSRDLRALHSKICAIGPATRRAVEALHLKVDLMPDEYVAEKLVEAFAAEVLEGKYILLPRAALARDVVPAELGRRGARVDVVEAYRTAVPENASVLAREIFSGPRKPDWITFTSASTVTNFVAATGAGALDDVRVASIGPVTSAAAATHGIAVTVEASEFTIDGLIAAILSAEAG
jgi:uroporphyrinogen III methyltransferase/synthase